MELEEKINEIKSQALFVSLLRDLENKHTKWKNVCFKKNKWKILGNDFFNNRLLIIYDNKS